MLKYHSLYFCVGNCSLKKVIRGTQSYLQIVAYTNFLRLFSSLIFTKVSATQWLIINAGIKICFLDEVNPCLHAGIVVLQQYRAGVNPPKLTLLYTIETGSARATRWCQGQ